MAINTGTLSALGPDTLIYNYPCSKNNPPSSTNLTRSSLDAFSLLGSPSTIDSMTDLFEDSELKVSDESEARFISDLKTSPLPVLPAELFDDLPSNPVCKKPRIEALEVAFAANSNSSDFIDRFYDDQLPSSLTQVQSQLPQVQSKDNGGLPNMTYQDDNLARAVCLNQKSLVLPPWFMVNPAGEPEFDVTFDPFIINSQASCFIQALVSMYEYTTLLIQNLQEQQKIGDVYVYSKHFN